MIPDAIRHEIQSAYSEFLEALGHRPRQGQKQMIASIARCLMHSQHKSKIIAIEAGTGTGKTLAYLVATLPIARELGKTLVISTGTVALQEQLIYKDIPDVIDKSGLRFGYSLVKGRGRYLCHLKLDQLLSGMDNSDQLGMYLDGDIATFKRDSLKLYQAMDAALRERQWDGDRDSWDDPIDEADWRPLTSDRYQCTGRTCPHVTNCAFFNARNDLEDVLCLVTNHDLVLSDLALGGGAILPPPEDCIYVFDEAHHLGDKARNHFSSRFRVGASLGFYQQILDTLPKLRSALENIKGVSALSGELTQCIDQLIPNIQGLKSPIASLFENESSHDHQEQSTDVRFAHGRLPSDLKASMILAQPMVERSQVLLEQISDKLDAVLSGESNSASKQDAESWFPLVGQWLARVQGYAALFFNISMTSDEQSTSYARWARLHASADDYEIFSTPVLADEILQSQLWDRCGGAILTSATLTALGKFDRLQLKTGLPKDFENLALLSPFDYPSNGLLRVLKSAPDPRDFRAHDDYLIDEIPNMLDIEKGNLVLFSSARQMDTVYENIDLDWQKRILIQGARSKQKLIESHKSRIDAGEGSTIFGLASFAEGIDLPGDYCAHVLIAKIPFSVPTAPEEEAFSEWIEAKGGKPFFDISLPDASMRLVQAAGRLLRSEADTGIISIADNRMATKSYGKQLLSALPPYRVEFV